MNKPLVIQRPLIPMMLQDNNTMSNTYNIVMPLIPPNILSQSILLILLSYTLLVNHLNFHNINSLKDELDDSNGL